MFHKCSGARVKMPSPSIFPPLDDHRWIKIVVEGVTPVALGSREPRDMGGFSSSSQPEFGIGGIAPQLRIPEVRCIHLFRTALPWRIESNWQTQLVTVHFGCVCTRTCWLQSICKVQSDAFTKPASPSLDHQATVPTNPSGIQICRSIRFQEMSCCPRRRWLGSQLYCWRSPVRLVLSDSVAAALES